MAARNDEFHTRDALERHRSPPGAHSYKIGKSGFAERLQNSPSQKSAWPENRDLGSPIEAIELNRPQDIHEEGPCGPVVADGEGDSGVGGPDLLQFFFRKKPLGISGKKDYFHPPARCCCDGLPNLALATFFPLGVGQASSAAADDDVSAQSIPQPESQSVAPDPPQAEKAHERLLKLVLEVRDAGHIEERLPPEGPKVAPPVEEGSQETVEIGKYHISEFRRH